jgi:hypothetical protein
MKTMMSVLLFDLALMACSTEPAADLPDAPLDGAAAQCGNGLVDPGEICDPGIVATCAELGALWTTGTASCRSDCMRWDVASCARVEPDRWETVEPATRDPQWPTARCNDGSPFDFDVRLAAQPTQTWVIYLGGGAFCDDLAHPCNERAARLKSSSLQADRELTNGQVGGILSRNPTMNPTFALANHVSATYCSSDLWAGATTDRRPTAGDPVNGWYFSGHTNVVAMLDVLKQRYGLDDSDAATQVLFSGSSAGGLGAHFNAAVASAALPGTAARAHLRLFVDAGWMADFVDPDPELPTYFIGAATVADAEVWRRARTFWGATFDPACEAAVADPSRCLLGAVWYPYVAARMPTLIQQSAIDATFTSNHGIDTTTSNPQRDAWHLSVETSLLGVSWLFSGDTPYHTLATIANGLATGPAGSRLRDVLDRFWSDGAPERVEF